MKPSAKPVKLKSTVTRSATGWHYLVIPAETANRFKRERTRRVVCTLNEIHTFQCALLGNGKGDFCVPLNKPLREKLGVGEGSTVTVLLEEDTSKYGLPMPEEFEEVMQQDPDGGKLFHELTPGNQRLIIRLISAPADVDKRIHRSLITIEHLKKTDGKFVYEELHAALKRPVF